MALFQPTNVIPSINTNTGVVDVTQPMKISWIVNGNQNMVAFQIDFYKNDATSTFIDSTGIIGLTSDLTDNAAVQNANGLPFAGVNGVGDIEMYTYASVKTWNAFNGAFTNITDGINRHPSYKFKITQWYGQYTSVKKGFSSSGTTSLNANTWYYLRGGTGIFLGFYIDASTANRITEQVVAYWDNATNSGYLIGVTSNTAYFVRTQYINQANVPSGWIPFENQETTTVGYTYTHPSSFECFYSSYINIPTIYYLTATGNKGSVSGNIARNKITFVGDFASSVVDAISAVKWELAYGNGDETGATIVDTGFIPTHTLEFEYNGFQNNQSYAIRCTIKQDIAMGATQIVSTPWYFFGISLIAFPFNGSFSAQYIRQENCVLLQWNSSTNFSGYRIYRQEIGKQSTFEIATVDSSVTVLKDYGVKSRTLYKYTIFGDVVSFNYSSFVEAENTIATNFKNYSLLVCDYDQENDAYHVRKQYLFALNLTDGSVGNNNLPTLNANFTAYPTRMPSTQNYASGTLSGLIGAIYTVPALIEQIGQYKYTAKPSTLDYFDSVDLEQELYGLSVAPYQLFLRDMKGRLRMIATSAPITMTTNLKQRQQSISISLPWVEVGDASDVTIIQTPDDYGWNNDNQVLDVQLDVDVATGELSAQYPFPYTGTKFYLTGVNKENLTAKTPLGVTPAQLELSDTAQQPDDGELTATAKVNSETNANN